MRQAASVTKNVRARRRVRRGEHERREREGRWNQIRERRAQSRALCERRRRARFESFPAQFHRSRPLSPIFTPIQNVSARLRIDPAVAEQRTIHKLVEPRREDDTAASIPNAAKRTASVERRKDNDAGGEARRRQSTSRTNACA